MIQKVDEIIDTNEIVISESQYYLLNIGFLLALTDIFNKKLCSFSVMDFENTQTLSESNPRDEKNKLIISFIMTYTDLLSFFDVTLDENDNHTNYAFIRCLKELLRGFENLDGVIIEYLSFVISEQDILISENTSALVDQEGLNFLIKMFK